MSKLLGVHIPAELKNIAINGNFDFWQRVEGTTTTINTATNQNAYTADMWAFFSGGASTHNFSIAQAANTSLTEAQSGFQSSLVYSFTRITGLVSFGASDYTVPACLRVEGFDYAKIHGKTATFGFWVNASVAGTYSFVVQNGAQTRNYVTTFTVTGGTWQFVTISVVMEVPTTNYTFTSGLGIQVLIGGVTGTTFATSTLNSWQAGQIFAASGTTNWMATTGATLQIAQFSIVEGPLGFGATGFARQGKTIQQELALCQRYYQKSFAIGTAPATGVNNVNSGMWIARYSAIGAWAVSSQLAVPMRTAPSFTGFNPVSANANWRDIDNNVDVTSFGGVQSTKWLGIYSAGNGATGQTAINWTLDAGL